MRAKACSEPALTQLGIDSIFERERVDCSRACNLEQPGPGCGDSLDWVLRGFLFECGHLPDPARTLGERTEAVVLSALQDDSPGLAEYSGLHLVASSGEV